LAERTGLFAKYRITDHVADVGLTIYGNSYEDLFAHGAYALFSLLTDLRRVRRIEKRKFSLFSGPDALIHFLNELLFLWDTERFIAKSTRVTKDGQGQLYAIAEGELYDPSRHFVKKEVKAVTYHEFSIKTGEHGYEARLVLDL
jgi:SHS2 domain-containing protein